MRFCALCHSAPASSVLFCTALFLLRPKATGEEKGGEEKRMREGGKEERNERRAQGFIFLFPPMLLLLFFLAQTPQNSLYILGWPQ